MERERGNELNKAMLYLMNSKNKQAKKDLRLASSQGNMTAYLTNIQAMDQYLSTQYANNKPISQSNGKRGVTNKGDDRRSEDKDNTQQMIYTVHKTLYICPDAAYLAPYIHPTSTVLISAVWLRHV